MENDQRNEVAETRECVDCHNQFDITNGEVTFFQDKNMTLPKRCKNCRALKKQAKEQK